jgi:hypothetical protein
MKTRLQAITALIFCASICATQAQMPGRGLMMGARRGLDLSGAARKLFGDNSSFSANMTTQTTGSDGGQPVLTTGKISASDGKSRFEPDMSKMGGASMSPDRAAMMKSMGMDKMVMIGRPDKKVTQIVYPGMNAYAEMAIPDSAGSAAWSQAKVDMTELGKETVDGHPCVKNKVVVTDDQANKHEFTVWNATDLKNFPVKIETLQNGTTLTTTFSDVKLDEVADDQFEPPTGATKYDSVQTLMQQEMMKRAAARGAGQ